MIEGCPNCDRFLQLQGSDDRIRECTSQVYEGLITINDPQQSWVAKWQRLEGYVPGVYAVKVSGIVRAGVPFHLPGLVLVMADFVLHSSPRTSLAMLKKPASNTSREC